MSLHSKENFQPFEVVNRAGGAQVVLLCEHASNRIPDRFSGLGLGDAARASHAAWDPGALALSCVLSRELDAVLVASTVSRLVYDCNRPPEAASAMPAKSELIEVPGNVNLTPSERDVRVHEVYEPFCNAVAQVLDSRGADTVVVTIHSFTPVYFGQPRDVELGLLHDSDDRIALAMTRNSGLIPHRLVRLNEPYAASDGVTHSLRKHALSRGLANVMIEVRNDLLRDEHGINDMARDILTLLRPALAELTTQEVAE